MLRDTLEVLELTQTKLAAELGVPQSRISEYLSGIRPIRQPHEMALKFLLVEAGKWPLRATVKTHA